MMPNPADGVRPPHAWPATATTRSVLVLEGEQHVQDIHPNGGLAFFGCRTADGRLYDIVDDDGEIRLEVTIDFLLAAFAAAATDV
jgi:hypothetical protein